LPEKVAIVVDHEGRSTRGFLSNDFDVANQKLFFPVSILQPTKKSENKVDAKKLKERIAGEQRSLERELQGGHIKSWP
jgi:hypothetical protein